MRLRGKVALVTGAADDRSIGWGIARELAREGADVVVNDVAFADKLAAREQDLAALGVRGLGVQADISDPQQVDALVQQTVREMGRLDIVCANAGIIRWESFLEITPANLRKIVNVNLKGTVYTCQSAARQMIAQGQGGRIIITSSVQADMHFSVTPVYGGSKHAMHTLVGTLALELAPYQITVNHFGPGWVRSALNDPAPDQQSAEGIEANRRNVPLHRDGWIEEMGRTAVYFVSADGAYTTGAFLRVDGGLGISKFTLDIDHSK